MRKKHVSPIVTVNEERNTIFVKKRFMAILSAAMNATLIQVILAVAVTCTALASDAKAQILDRQASLSVENTEISIILDELQKQADVKFVYSPTVIPVDKVASIHVSEKKLREILNQLLAPYEIQFKVVNERILLYKAAAEQTEEETAGLNDSSKDLTTDGRNDELTINGRVTDENGQSIPGVNIILKDTRYGTTTDVDGNYNFRVPQRYSDGVLVFSFIGYQTTEINIGGQSTINVTLLEEIASLDEIIITGYQEIRKESFTGTAIVVSGEELKQINPTNLLQSVQAFDPSFKVMENNLLGSNPNSMPNITVRGATGLPGSASSDGSLSVNTLSKNNLSSNPNLPTFILNGFEVSLQTVYDLDMNRVESVTLLKDAAATAVYGSRAANGVLVITTKAPEEGKLRFTYNYELTVAGPDLSVYNVLNAEEKLEYERLAGLYSNNEVLSQTEMDKLYYEKKKNVLRGVDTYWLSEPVDMALGHSNSFSIEGGSDVLLYSITGRYQNIDGVMKESSRNRYGGDVFLSYNLDDKLIFQNNLSVSEVTSQESPYGSFRQYVQMNPYYLKYDENGNLIREVDDWVGRDFNEVGAHVVVNDNVLNPAYDASLSNFDKNKYTQIINSFSAKWKIANGLSLRGLLSLTKTQSTADKFTSPYSNEYFNYADDRLKERGEYNFRSNNETTVDGNMVLAYHKNIGQNFINASLGANVTDYTSDYKGFTAIGFTSDKFANIGFANQYRDEDSPEGVRSIERLLGSFLNINYSRSDKYLLDLAVRVDGSSKFGTDNKFAPFWATGIGWNLHKEGFLSGSNIINRLKIRASTGLTGEVSFPSYMAKTTYQYYNDWYSSGVGAVHKGFGNESLKWQRTQNYDLGMEISLWENRVYIAPRYYYKLTQDLLADIIVPPSMGFTSYKANLGKMENKGFELNMNVSLYRSKNWLINVHANLVRNKNTIMEVSESLKKYNDEVDEMQQEEEYYGTSLLRYNEGQSLNTIYGVPSLGIDPETGKEIYVKRDGTHTYEHDVKDIVPIGDATPEAEGFFGTAIAFKSFLFTANFYTSYGGDLYNQTLVDRVENADPRYNVDQRVLDDRWKEPGDLAMFKDIANQEMTNVTSRFIQQYDVVELKSLNLTYETSESFAEKLRMQSLQLMVTMNDIWRWSTVEQERGIDYPFARSVTFSIRTRF